MNNCIQKTDDRREKTFKEANLHSKGQLYYFIKVIMHLASLVAKPCCVGPPKMDRSWWRVLTECGPLEKGIANHFSILALRTP